MSLLSRYNTVKNLSTPRDKALFAFLEQELHIKPGNFSIYITAFTHKSKEESAEENNERLEFLGDAILNSIISDFLFKKFDSYTEGSLTNIRSLIVSRKILNIIGVELKLNRFIKKGTYINHSHTSIVGNALEALIGALFIDKGYNKTYSIVINKLIEPFINIDELKENQNNFKSQLLEHCQKNKLELSYSTNLLSENPIENEFESTVSINGNIVSSGKGSSKKRAEQSAAKNAMIVLTKT